MGISHFLACVSWWLAATATAQAGAKSSKRGLIYIPPSSPNPGQNDPFVAPSSDLTWYYNYNAAPTTALSNSSSVHPLEFVPQLWGQPGTGFADAVNRLLDSPGNNISSLLFMNEPDAGKDGGSGVDPKDAAKIWHEQFASIKEKHPDIQLGSPAVTSAPSGFTWLAEWFAACDPACEPDFMAVHYYGPFEGLPFHVNQVNQTFSNITAKGGMWITEFGFIGQDLPTSERFFNDSIGLLDTLEYVKRYSYFGSFKAKDSNIGPNSAMLDNEGRLTDIGSWYLGGGATGVKPNAAAGKGTSFIGLMIALLAVSALEVL